MEQAQAILDLWRMFLRRFWIIAIITVIGGIASVFYAKAQPALFQAEAKILVESQQIPDALARSTVTASASERLQVIQQRLMTRNNLVNLIEQLNLYADRNDLTLTEKIDLLRQNAWIQPIALTGNRRNSGNLSAFTIKVNMNNPGKAAQVANEFVTTVLDQNIRARSQRASETLSFFIQEEARISQELVALEAEIANYKAENGDALPGSLDFRREELIRLTDSDLEFDRRLLELEEELGTLETALEQGTAANVSVSDMSPEERELRRLEAELAQQRAIYGENHRSIRTIKARMAAIESLIPAAETEGQQTTDGGQPSRREVAIQRQIKLLSEQIALLRDQKEVMSKRAVELRESIQQTPNVEIQLNALYRAHIEKQEMLSVITRKRAEAETGEKLEVNRQAERFEVIENAVPPPEPISPNRKKIVIMGSGASLALALGLAFLVEIMKPAIRTAAQLERQLELRPVVSIPYIQTPRERFWRRMKVILAVAILVIGLPLGLYAVDQFYLPLPLVVEQMSERAGIDTYITMIQGWF